MDTTITREIVLSVERATRLSHLAQAHKTSESELVEQALDIFFSLTASPEEESDAPRSASPT